VKDAESNKTLYLKGFSFTLFHRISEALEIIREAMGNYEFAFVGRYALADPRRYQRPVCAGQCRMASCAAVSAAIDGAPPNQRHVTLTVSATVPRAPGAPHRSPGSSS
jgi:hypothetical protein